MPDRVKAKVVGRDAIRAHYQDSDVAAKYERERFSFPLAEAVSRREIALVKHLVAALPPGAKLLNIATGPARIARHLKPSGEAVALDSSREMLEIARAHLARNDWKLVEGDAFSLPWSGPWFDLAFAFRFFRHFELEDRLALYREARRVLRPDGYLVFEALIQQPGSVANSVMYEQLWTEPDLVRELADAEFRVESLVPVYRHPALYGRIYGIGRRAHLGHVVAPVVAALDAIPLGSSRSAHEWVVVARAR